jgi:molecular chaperone DnaK
MKELGIGIDFGTTNSLVALWGRSAAKIRREQGLPGQPVALWADDRPSGLRPHPSVVWYKPDDTVVVGFEARRNMQELSNTLGHNFVRSIKRSLLSTELMHGGRRHQPYQIAAEIFNHLRQHGQTHPILHGQEFKHCVVTIPVGFSGEHRRQIRRAMEQAGLELQTFVHEPFAAMVSHFYEPETKLASIRGKRVLVFDWGGGTLDVCLAEGSQDGSTLFELAHDGIADHAGDDFDRRIMAELRGRFLDKNAGLTADDITNRCRAQDRFWLAAERAKIELSDTDSVRLRVPGFLDGNPPLDLSEGLVRSEFEEMIQQEVEAALACTQRCLDRARLHASSVDYVLLVGGTSQIPLVRQRLEEMFGAKVQLTHEPDAAIAKGGAIIAAEGWEAVNAVTIGCMMAHDTYFPLLKRGESLVASSSKKYVFYCTDPRDGTANFIFCRQSVEGDSALEQFGTILQVPVQTEHPAEFRELDRLLVRASVTADATLLMDVTHTGRGDHAQNEISDIAFGLKLNS